MAKAEKEDFCTVACKTSASVVYDRGMAEYLENPEGKGKSAHNWAFARRMIYAWKLRDCRDADLYKRIRKIDRSSLWHFEDLDLCGFALFDSPNVNREHLKTWMSEVNERLALVGVEPLSIEFFTEEIRGNIAKEVQESPRYYFFDLNLVEGLKTIFIHETSIWFHYRPDIALGALVHQAGKYAAMQIWKNYHQEAAFCAAHDLLGYELLASYPCGYVVLGQDGKGREIVRGDERPLFRG